MKIWNRAKNLLSEPTYRTKLGFFIVVGGILSLITFQIEDPLLQSLFQEFAVVFITVAFIQFLWDFLGGEPMELEIQEVQKDIVRVGQSLTLLQDLVKGHIGLERIWPDRGSWQLDTADGLTAWHHRVCVADCVEVVSITWWSNWTQYRDTFQTGLFANIARGALLRVLIYDPDSDIAVKRAKDEKDPPGQMQHEATTHYSG